MTTRTGGRASVDAFVWGLASSSLLALADIGFVSGDAVKHANAFAQGSWNLNPNHLLMEPIAAAWFDVTTSLGWNVVGPDRLKGLSILFGATSVVLFRSLLSTRFGASRIRANISTLIFCSGYAFLALWISGEPVILQMPALVLAAVAALRYVSNPGVRDAVSVGSIFAFSALFFISNAVIGLVVTVALLLWRLWVDAVRSAFREAAAMAASLMIVGFGGLAIGWLVADPASSFLEWVTRYAGQTAVNESTSYGIRGGGLLAVATAGARSLYGAAMAVVDVSPVTEVLRGARNMDASATVSIVAFFGGFAAFAVTIRSAVRAKERHGAVALILGWIAGVLAFGAYFNNSDDQFYLQLAVPLAVLATVAPLERRRRRSLGPAVLGIALWNMTYVWSSLINYPRDERLTELSQAVEGARLVVYPGFDEPGRLLHLLPDSLYGARWSIMELSAEYDAEEGLSVLTDSIEHVVDDGGAVRIINIFGAHSGQHPWTALRIRGYEPDEITRRLREMKHPVSARFECAFTVWTVADSTGWPGRARCGDR